MKGDGDSGKNDFDLDKKLISPCERFAAIVQEAMGNLSIYEFASLSEISHTTLRRWLTKGTQNPDYNSLKKLEKYTKYTAEQLQAIVLGLKSEKAMQTPNYLTADELLFFAEQLSNEQLERFVQMAFNRLLERLKSRAKNNQDQDANPTPSTSCES